jgi:Glycosyl transferase family 2
VLSRIAVVVPAHDEQELLPHCLAALRIAVAGSAAAVEVIVVADDCADATAQVAAAAGAAVVRVTAGNVGEARAAGMAYALRHGTTGLWLATTDADSRVGPGWLEWHARHAASGTEVLVGTVEVPDWSPWPVAVRHAYEQRYRAALTVSGHRHVHGANLGCGAAAYAGLGGFAGIRHDEDRDLVTRATAAGLRVVYDTASPVLTSARRSARAPAGFAAHLASVADEVSARRRGADHAAVAPGVADHRHGPHRQDGQGQPRGTRVPAALQHQGQQVRTRDERSEEGGVTHDGNSSHEQYRRGSAGGSTGGRPSADGVDSYVSPFAHRPAAASSPSEKLR